MDWEVSEGLEFAVEQLRPVFVETELEAAEARDRQGRLRQLPLPAGRPEGAEAEVTFRPGGRRGGGISRQAEERVAAEVARLAEEEAQAAFREEQRQAEALLADAGRRRQAEEALRSEEAALEAEAADAHARAELLARGRRLAGATAATEEEAAELRQRLGAEEAEALELRRAVEGLEEDLHAPALDPQSQRLLWASRKRELEAELRECRRRIARLDAENSELAEQRLASALRREKLQRRLSALEDAFASAGADLSSAHFPDGSRDPLDVVLALCQALMPEVAERGPEAVLEGRSWH